MWSFYVFLRQVLVCVEPRFDYQRSEKMYETWPAYIQLVGGDYCQSSTVRFAVAKQTRHKFSLSKQVNILPDNWNAFS